MARKVLISFLGTGPLLNNDGSKDHSSNKREYRTANYQIDNKEYVRSFVADALTDHYKIDTVFMIGTVKSMWEELYRVFCEKRNEKIDEEYYFKLAASCDEANSKSPLKLLNKEKIEEVLGKGSHIELINYGLSEEQLNENITKILGLEEKLKNGDELYIDITHSFRSLPLLVMNTLIYLQNVSKKKIKIKHISYGMLDVVRELNYVPVVDLRKLLEVNEWITAAYSFSQFGNANKIVELLNEIDNEASKNVSKRVLDFSNANHLNHINALQNSVQQLQGLGGPLNSLPSIAKMTIGPVVKDFINTIGNFKTTSEFQYNLAKWHRDRHNYYAAYLTLVESIITYVCDECLLCNTNKNDRDLVKKEKINLPKFENINEIYIRVKDLRNALAHASDTRENNEAIKKTLNKAIDDLKPIIKG